jgi:hypothetical protein
MRRNRSAVGGILQKDSFGVIWVALLFLFVGIIRFWVLDSSLIDAGNCLPCVLAVVLLISIFISLLLTGVWVFWAARAPITMGFYFILGGIGVLCAMLVNKISQAFVNILYQKGLITWQADSIELLHEQIVPHLTGLYLGSLMVFLAIRMLMVKEIQNRLALTLTSVSVAGSSAIVLFLGIKMY